MTGSSAQLGRIGERVAARHLAGLGYEILDRNWRCARGAVRGELDLVARDADVLVFCEVKTRRRVRAGEPLAAVDARKLARLRRLAAAWLATTSWSGIDVRFDVVAVSWPPGGGAAEVLHLRGVAG